MRMLKATEEQASIEAAEHAVGDAMELREGVTYLANNNFDPAEMSSIRQIDLNNTAEFDSLIEQGYVCYQVIVIRFAAGIYNYGHRTVAILAKKREPAA